MTRRHPEALALSKYSNWTRIRAGPDSLTKTVYATSLYSTHGQNTLTNTTDSIMQDSYTNELLTISGNTTDGYTATFKVGVPL